MSTQRGLFTHLPRIVFSATLLVLVALLASVLSTGIAQAQGSVTPRHTDPFWQASYWNNTTLSGTPVLNREDRSLDFDWGTGSPDGVVSSDNFSARWARYIDVTPGDYIFTAISDDGIRVRIDGELVIDAWWEHSPTQFTGTKFLSAGHHLLEVEYYEKGGGAVAKLSWQAGPPPITAWKGEYFNNKSLSGTPVVVRNDTAINFDWGTGSPAAGITPDGFSARWSQKISLAAGMYRFRMTVDDGARLFVNGHTLIDAWKLQAATEHTGDIYLPGGSITVQMEYFEEGGYAAARLSWAPVGSGPAPTPTPVPPTPGGVIVDNRDAGFVRGGTASGWASADEGYSGHLYWTQNNDRARPGYNWGRWYPSLSAGRYEVFVYIPNRYSTTSSARYWVSHAGGFTQRVVNQSASGDRWVSLGTYNFRGDKQDYVSLADVTGETYLSRLIAWDAMKWVVK
ncbi:MAG: hypothetical protein DWI57_15090 [Chloroflexi bacterium]|nr:MAG: hypothetical protein DWI57_15090 [Chloroflexota bacterium]